MNRFADYNIVELISSDLFFKAKKKKKNYNYYYYFFFINIVNFLLNF